MAELLILSLGLAMDAFAVALVRGSTGQRSWIRAIELGLAFGVAQGVMPLIGWGLGQTFGGAFSTYDHWIAFGLLLVLGLRMLYEALTGEEDEAPSTHSHWITLATAAFATSVDAAAAGMTLPLLGVMVPLACVTIGATTAVLCTAGYAFGSRVPDKVAKRAELVGGVVLIGLGTKILIEHLSA